MLWLSFSKSKPDNFTSPTTCPHGRPVILRLTMKDIERDFHRM